MSERRRGRGKKDKSKTQEPEPIPETLEVPKPLTTREKYFTKEKSPFEVGDKAELQVASSHAIIDKAAIMDISGGPAVSAKVDEYISLLFTDHCALDKASFADISEVKIVVIEEDTPDQTVQPAVDIEAELEKAKQEAEEREKREQAEREAAERRAKEEEARKVREEAERLVREEEERKEKERLEEERLKKEEEEKIAKKLKDQEEKKKKEEEAARKKAEEEEARRLAEEEALRNKTPEYDSDVELIPVKEEFAPDVWETVEEPVPLVPVQLEDLLALKAEEDGENKKEEEVVMTEKDRDLEWQRQRQMMRPPLVISHLKSRAGPAGTTIKLTCNVSGPNLSVRWFKNGNPVEINPNKYKFFSNEGLLSLEILNLERSDNGDYMCFIKNKNGETSTNANVTCYETLDSAKPEPPILVSIKESYSLHKDELTLECRVRGYPKPNIQWIKDGDYITPGDKYETREEKEGICKLIIVGPNEQDCGTYSCEAESNGASDTISHNVQFEGREEYQFLRTHRYYHRDPLKPHFILPLADNTVPSGGSICLFIETSPNAEAQWFRDRYPIDHKPPKRYLFDDKQGFFGMCINHATLDESAKYVCKVTNAFGTSQSSANVDVINPNSCGKGQKPPGFLTRPQTEIKIRAGDPFSMSFRVAGEPKPRIQWYKGAKEITNLQRTVKEVFNDYVRFSYKESTVNDSGIYFIVARNKHGVDRAFCQLTVKQSRTKKDDKIDDKVEAQVENVQSDRSEKGRE